MRYQLHHPIIITKQRHPKRWLGGLTLLVLIVIVIIKLLTAPAQGHTNIVDQAVKSTRHQTVKPAPASTLDNKYFRLRLPVGYSLNNTQTAAADSLLSATIFKPSTGGTSIINVAVVNLPPDGLTNLSAYRVRSQSPATYKLESTTIKGDTVALSTRLDGESGEVVALWPHGAYVATLAVSTGTLATSGDTAANLKSLQTLLAAWQWH